MSLLMSILCCSDNPTPTRITTQKHSTIKFSDDIDSGFKRNGIGTYIYDNGDQYDGQWMENKRHGRGKMIYKNGDFFLGEWIADKKGGRGLYVFSNMDKYEGQWKNDLMDGIGKLTYENGSYYQGQFNQGKKDGKGVYYNSETKRKYNQQYRAGQRTHRMILKDAVISPNKRASKVQLFDRPKVTQQDIELFIEAHPEMAEVGEAQMLYYYGICRIKNEQFFKTHPKNWTIDQVLQWSKAVGISNSCQQALKKQKIAGKVLLDTKMSELNDYLKMPLGDRKKWISAIQHLKKQYSVKQKQNSQKQKDKQKTRQRKKSTRVINHVESAPQRKRSFTFNSARVSGNIPNLNIPNNPILEQNDEFQQQPNSGKKREDSPRKPATHHNLYQTQDLNAYQNQAQQQKFQYQSQNVQFNTHQNERKSQKQSMKLSQQQNEQTQQGKNNSVANKKIMGKKKSEEVNNQIQNKQSSSSQSSSSSSSSSQQQNPRKRKKSKQIRHIQMRQLYQYLRNHKISMNFLIPENQITNLEQIGQGGYGKVYKAKWLSNPVAVKTYMKSGRLHKKGLQNFLQQVGILNDLRHPNIVLYMGMCIQINRYSLITQYLEWGSLFDLLHKKKTHFDNVTIFNIVEDIALGMVYLHAKDVLHRDLKSSNVLMDQDSNVKLCDFGLSQVHPKKKMKNPKTRVGTYQWMAPQVLRRQKYDFPADVYSFGMIIWQILSQQIPYDNMSLNQIVGTVGYDQTHRIECPTRGEPYLIDLMYDCLKYKLEDRPSFMQILARLSQYKNQKMKDSVKKAKATPHNLLMIKNQQSSS